MEQVHFLNIEYLLLRVYDIIHNSSLFTATYGGATAPASSAISIIAVALGSIALIGMIITLAFFVFLVWVRIRLEVVEHEGFHGKEHELHDAETTVIVAGHSEPVGPKNPRWEQVRELANTTSESDWRLAILEADIMLGDLLKEQGYRGEGIGERLRDANPLQFHTLDLAWTAHKVRNDIAHAGSDFHLSQREANSTIDLYRRVFEEFDYI
jgi:hypothetical protein